MESQNVVDAMKAIEAVYSDTTVSRTQTIESLEELQEEIEIRLASLDEPE